MTTTTPVPNQPVRLSTPNQRGYLRRLLDTRSGPQVEGIRTRLNSYGAPAEVPFVVASAAITQLEQIRPDRPQSRPAPGKTTPAGFKWAKHYDLPEGNYALQFDGEPVKFYSVRQMPEDHPKWANWTFVDVHASEERHALKGEARAKVLDAILADPQAAAVLYGQETNHCFRCGRELTDEISRAAGIGPICAGKVGWA